MRKLRDQFEKERFGGAYALRQNQTLLTTISAEIDVWLPEANSNPEKGPFCLRVLDDIEQELDEKFNFIKLEDFFRIITKFQKNEFDSSDFENLKATHFSTNDFVGLLQVLFKLLDLYKQTIDLNCRKLSEQQLIQLLEKINLDDEVYWRNGHSTGVNDNNKRDFLMILNYLKIKNLKLAENYEKGFRNYRNEPNSFNSNFR